MKTNPAFFVAPLMLCALPAFAADDFEIPGAITGSLALTSDYTSRGISNSSQNPALQGSFTYTIPLDDTFNVYAGVWGSNVNFNDGGEANLELDWIAGVTWQHENLSLDTGVIYYYYPDAATSFHYNYTEFQGTVGYNLDPVFLRASVNYSPNIAPEAGHSEYYKLGADVTLLDNLKLKTQAGYQAVENNAAFTYDDYYHWGAGLTYTIKGVDLSIDYSDSDIKKSQCATNCDSRVIFTIAKSF